MRMSCNGCRVLRKGCSQNCSIRPSLQWIKTPQSQANATFFLAKFYGRAGLVNLINAGPHHLRPAVFKSLLFEACGRIVNPIFGSAGLLWSGSWQLCEDAVEAVLKGEPIVSVSDETAASHMNLPLKCCDIRHVSKEYESSSSASASASVRKIKTRRRFKRVEKSKPKECLMFEFEIDHESVLSQRRSNDCGGGGGGGCGGDDNGDCLSMETVEASVGAGKGADVELELNLGLGIQLDERDADVSILWKRHV